MSAVVCTLFEGNYHHGVAALVNSLYQHGFRGTVYAGYKGSLPPWVEKTKQVLFAENLKAEEFLVTEGLSITFVKLDTDYHLTNYKPAFMLQVVDNLKHNIDSIFYFDPDIVVKCNWSFFEKWVKYGVAVVNEIISNNMDNKHPMRLIWKEIIEKCKLKVRNELNSYINAGFLGVNMDSINFIESYNLFVNYSSTLEGINLSKFTWNKDRTDPFYAKDQDALNMAAMASETTVCPYGPEGMDFIHGGSLMSHAVGGSKPWKKNYVTSFLKGYPPSLQDKEFWRYSQGVIRSLSQRKIAIATLLIKATSFLGRFYRRY